MLQPCLHPCPEVGRWGWHHLPLAPLGLGGSAGHFRVTFAFVGSDVVFLLELLAADVAGELVEGVSVVFLHMPVQGGFLAAGEAADLTPGRKQNEIQGERI